MKLNIWYYRYYLMSEQKPTYVGFIRFFLQQLTADLICKVFDHKWEDISTAGPESGNIHMYCKRCGCVFKHILY